MENGKRESRERDGEGEILSRKSNIKILEQRKRRMEARQKVTPFCIPIFVGGSRTHSRKSEKY